VPAQPSLSQLGSTSGALTATAVRVSDRCRALARKVAEPSDYPGKNVYQSRLEYRAALAVANKRLGASNECMARLSADYAKGLPPAAAR